MRAKTAAAAAIAAALLVGALAAAPARDQQPKRSAAANANREADPAKSAITRPAEAAELAALPEGPAKALVAERCSLCHSAGLITQQHKDAAAWGRTVTQMRAWGTPIQDEDQTAIVAYLAEHFGPKPAPR